MRTFKQSCGVTVRERLADLFSRALHVEVPSVDTDLFEAGILDSLAFVELLLHLEREFGVVTSVDDLEVENFRSIARIAEFIEARAPAEQPRVVNFGTRE
jgi:D-alanine--poly(phosphoribitol) ligase subunit 2